jgi:hypothetical protein
MEQARFDMLGMDVHRAVTADALRRLLSLLPCRFRSSIARFKFMVPLALGPSLFRSQHVGELGQQVAFFLPNEHEIIFSVLSTHDCTFFVHLLPP